MSDLVISDTFDSVEYSGLPLRLIRILHNNDIRLLSQLAGMSDANILLLRNVGGEYLRVIRIELRTCH